MTNAFRWGVPPAPSEAVGWVFQAYADERLALRPRGIIQWSDARTAGKEAGQPVLFLQAGRHGPTWTGWGAVYDIPERWRVFGVRTICRGIARPALPARELPRTTPTVPPRARPYPYVWENRALACALGLGGYRDRTPFGSVGSRALRLTASDRDALARLQPGLQRFGSP
jgi:hypothetical protein